MRVFFYLEDPGQKIFQSRTQEEGGERPFLFPSPSSGIPDEGGEGGQGGGKGRTAERGEYVVLQRKEEEERGVMS